MLMRTTGDAAVSGVIFPSLARVSMSSFSTWRLACDAGREDPADKKTSSSSVAFRTSCDTLYQQRDVREQGQKL
jgi:hypothetical protein